MGAIVFAVELKHAARLPICSSYIYICCSSSTPSDGVTAANTAPGRPARKQPHPSRGQVKQTPKPASHKYTLYTEPCYTPARQPASQSARTHARPARRQCFPPRVRMCAYVCVCLVVHTNTRTLHGFGRVCVYVVCVWCVFATITILILFSCMR